MTPSFVVSKARLTRSQRESLVEKTDSSKPFLLGAGAMLAGVLAGGLLKSATIENFRNAFLFVEEVKGQLNLSQQPRPFVIPPQETDEEEDDLKPTNYSPYYDREVPPPPPPSYERPIKPAVSMAISKEEDDFYERMNEEAIMGRSLVDDWTQV
jgi:hypothetical protein